MRVTIEKKTDQLVVECENWVAVPGYVGIYEVSDQGRMRSVARTLVDGRRWRSHPMTPTVREDGYLSVSLWENGRRRSFLLHRIVLSAFHGEAPEGTEGLHADGDKSNNALENLSWGTRSQNIRDQVAHGSHANATKTHCAEGHPFTEGNTYYYPGRVHRACRECRRAYQRAHRLKAKAAVA